MKDLISFYNGDYRKDGILNAYLRLMDVYTDLCTERNEHYSGKTKIDRPKIFDTSLYEEFLNESNPPGVSAHLDEELQDILEHQLLIIPIYVSSSF